MARNIVIIDYTNWRGERRRRLIKPTGFMLFDANAWHAGDPQWLLEAFDIEDDSRVKMFAMKDIHKWEPFDASGGS